MKISSKTVIITTIGMPTHACVHCASLRSRGPSAAHFLHHARLQLPWLTSAGSSSSEAKTRSILIFRKITMHRSSFMIPSWTCGLQARLCQLDWLADSTSKGMRFRTTAGSTSSSLKTKTLTHTKGSTCLGPRAAGIRCRVRDGPGARTVPCRWIISLWSVQFLCQLGESVCRRATAGLVRSAITRKP